MKWEDNKISPKFRAFSIIHFQLSIFLKILAKFDTNSGHNATMKVNEMKPRSIYDQ